MLHGMRAHKAGVRSARGIDFDGFDPIEVLLLEAKGPGYAKFLEIVAEKPFADFLRAAFSNLRFKIEVVYIPPRPPAP
ncbi:Tox-REase-5 domain-containing protein [Corallococcus coralloides]|uniref:Tox-REase-5 domain-containing protein n=1 Tax=Corallococcus coralloides TaxID=184914 RepID=UPI00384AAE67